MPNQEYVEDEINLRDYINVLIKRKKIILTVFFAAVITTAVVSFLMPKVYESSSKIQLGSIDKFIGELLVRDELLIKKAEAKEILSGRTLLAPIIKELNLGIELERFKENIKIEDIKDTNLLKIKVRYHDPDMVVRINEAIGSSFVSYGQAIYRERVSPINEQLKELETEIESIQEDIKRTQNLITELLNSPAISQEEISLRIILLQNIIHNYRGHLFKLRDRRDSLKTALEKTRDFEIVESALEPERPIRPRKKLNVAIAGVLGLMFGTFLAFFTEYWGNTTRKKIS